MSAGTSQVSVDGVSKVHFSIKGEPLLALLDVTFRVEHNEFFSIVGPSGCGKTTLLNLLAGFEQPSRGELRVGGEPITQKQLDPVVDHFRVEAKAEGKPFPDEDSAAFRRLRNRLLGLLVYRTELRQAAAPYL